MLGRADPSRAARGVWLALGIDAVGHLIGLAFAEGNPDTIRGARVMAVVIPVVLAIFIWRRHRWPRWYLLIVASTAFVVAAFGLVSDADRQALVLVVVNAIELAVLIRTWPARQSDPPIEAVSDEAGSEHADERSTDFSADDVDETELDRLWTARRTDRGQS